MTLSTLLRRLGENPLVVSVQASEKSPVDHPETLLRLARASVQQGTKVLRLEGVKSVRVIKPELPIPTIGLLKRQYPGSDVYITPTRQDVDRMRELNCEVIAFDGTDRPRPGGDTVAQMIEHIHRRKGLAMADCDTLETAVACAAAGADLVSTTLSGYTPAHRPGPGPDLDGLRRICQAVRVPVIAEGRFSQRWEIEAALRIGAVGVVVGGAINDPVKRTRALAPWSGPAGAGMPRRGKVGAVDIGGTWLRFGVFDENWELLESDRTPYPRDRATRLDWIRAQADAGGVERIGVSTGGIVNPETGEVWTAKEYLMPDHVGVRFDEATMGRPTVAFGDGHATAWAHACLPRFAGCRVATLALGTGVGAGFVAEGRVWAGPRGEYPRVNDLPAPGGGTYEELLGGIHLGGVPDEEGQARAAVALGGAVRAVHDLYFPDAVVIGGSVGLSEWLRPEVSRLGLVLSPFGADAGLYGAAALALYPGWR